MAMLAIPFIIESFAQLSGKKVWIIVVAHVDEKHLLQLGIIKSALPPTLHHQDGKLQIYLLSTSLKTFDVHIWS